MTPTERDEIRSEIESIETWFSFLLTSLDPNAPNEPTREALLTAIEDLRDRVGKLKERFKDEKARMVRL